MQSTLVHRDRAHACSRVAAHVSRMLQPGETRPTKRRGNVSGWVPVSLTEIVAVGAVAGKGTLDFQGQSRSFKLAGGVTGGGGASSTEASGEVYNLRNISDFAGLYTQNSGEAGLDRSSTSDLWLRNRAGVVLHLRGTQKGMTLSLGREEILIEML